MNAKQLTLLLVLVVVLGAAGLMVYKQQNAARREGQPGVGRKVLENLAVTRSPRWSSATKPKSSSW
jgi:Flp pilus assembly protein CpaB